MKVRMVPHLDDLVGQPASGIQKVVEKYFKYLPAQGVELVATNATSYDVLAIHAGATDRFFPNDPVVAHNHGMYWTDDYDAAQWEHEGNGDVIAILRHARTITVPSRWVAKSFERDMHLSPAVIPHGVDWDEWQGGVSQGYILWNKNRTTDVCDPTPVNELALRMPDTQFLTTFAAPGAPSNVQQTGAVAHATMQQMVKGAALYLATAKETFGIGILEAMAAGIPVLAWDHGNASELITHGRTGYLAQVGNYDDLQHGAFYLARNRFVVSRAAREFATLYSWDRAAALVANQYALTVSGPSLPRGRVGPWPRGGVGVVIPVFNKADVVLRALASVMAQTLQPSRVMVVNNNSTDGFDKELIATLQRMGALIVNCGEQGVAHARNAGVEMSWDCEYICCLDADDEIAPTFLETCVAALERDNSLGIAYTGITAVAQDGSTFLSQWPGPYDYENFIVGKNQVPTCNVFRRELWRRAGGYRQRFAPKGAGAEDAELWLRMGALGGRGERVSAEGLFIYHLGGQVSGDPDYHEPNWRAGKPWLDDGRHPFASVAKPANGLAHPVRQYDQPLVSIIVPCGPGHARFLVDCLDSIEAQSNRQWEIVLVADGDDEEWQEIQHLVCDGYPFVTLKRTPGGGWGAGYARNAGVEASSGPLLLFLDADDWLRPDALNQLLAAYAENPLTIVYSQYIGHAFIDNPHELNRLNQQGRLMDYNEQTTEATILYPVPEFDCDEAMRQPDARRPYIWNAITSLVPRAFHLEIEGFDEEMESWEDWDYWLRMARSDHCFTRVNAPLMEYRFYSGRRRALANPTESGDAGRQLSSKLLEYMQAKYREDGSMGCRSCGGRKKSAPAPMQSMMAQTLQQGGINQMSSSDFVTVELIDGNIGAHRIVFQREDYGYREHGERFKMRTLHAKGDNRVRIIEDEQPLTKAAAQPLVLPAVPAKQLPVEEPAKNTLQNYAIHIKPTEPKITQDFDLLQTLGLTSEPGPLGAEGVAGIVEPEVAGIPAAPAAPVVQEVPEVPAFKLAKEGEGETLLFVKPIYDFKPLWGIGAERQDVLVAAGVKSLNGLIALDVAGIKRVLNVPEATAERILQSAREAANK